MRATWQRVAQAVPSGAGGAAAGAVPARTGRRSRRSRCRARDAPRASIVIPVYNQFAHTLTCLRALAAHPPQAAFEIIVVDDGSSDETERCAARRWPACATTVARENGGFIAACNDGAALARGEYVVFLNNDTVPQPGWLDALLATFDEHPGTGLVGAQLVYPDGRLQEAGGIVFADGRAGNYGRFDRPERSALLATCATSTTARARRSRCRASCSSARRLRSPLRAGLLRGHRPRASRCAPRAARVLYQPAVAGRAPGRRHRPAPTLDQGIKALPGAQPAACSPTVARRAARQSRPDGTTCASARPPIAQRQRVVLIIDAPTPQPDHDSASLRLFNLMRLLREEGAHVVFFAANRDA